MPSEDEPVEYPDAAILRRHGLAPDPVVEAYKKHVDRTLLEQNLARVTAQRWEVFIRALKLAEEMDRAGAKLVVADFEAATKETLKTLRS